MKNLISFFVPEKYKLDAELNRKARFIIWFVYFVVLISFPISVYTFILRPNDFGNIVVGFLIPPVLFFSLFILNMFN